MVAAGGFRSDLGRIGTSPFGCEETELCLRLTAGHPGSELRYEPAAVVRQHVPRARTTWRYFSSRCYAEGRSKAVVARYAGTRSALSSERRYVRRTLPAAVLRALGRRRVRAAGALGAGACLAAAGYATGRLARRHRGHHHGPGRRAGRRGGPHEEQAMREVPVFLYHSVSDDPPPWIAPYTVTPATFRRQIDRIVDSGRPVVPLRRLVAAILGGPPLPPRAAVLTFDDGFADFYWTVAPLLAERGLPATLYVTVGAVHPPGGPPTGSLFPRRTC